MLCLILFIKIIIIKGKTVNNIEVQDKHKISLFAAILMNINIMVGAGIFVVPSLMAKQAGNLSFLGWPAICLIFLPVVWSIAQLSKYFPEQGGFYTYSKAGINKTAGFISGWFYFLGYSAVPAIQILALREILVNQVKLEIVQDNPILFSVIVMAFFCLLNVLSMTFVSKIQNIVTIFKLVPLFFVILLILFYLNPNFTLNIGDIGTLRYVIPLTLFGFWGFESSSNISHLIKGDKRNASRSILIGFAVVVVLYTLFHFGLLMLMGAQNLADFGVPAFVNFLNIKTQVLSNLLSASITAAIVIAYVSSIFGVILVTSSGLHFMAKDHLFPFAKTIKKLNKNERPTYCIFITGAVSLTFVLLINNLIILNSILNFGALSAFLLTLTSLFLIQRRKKDFKQLPITILAFLSCFYLLFYSWILSGNDFSSRVISLIPLIFLALFGFLMFKLEENKNA